MAAAETDRTDPVKGFIAKIRKALGWATGDRREQARGELEELDAADEGSGRGRSADADVLDQAELDVRGDHGDLAPDATAGMTRPPKQPRQGG